MTGVQTCALPIWKLSHDGWKKMKEKEREGFPSHKEKKNCAGRPTFFKSLISKLSPALVNIIIRANFLKSGDIFNKLGANKFKTYGPKIIPVKSIPTSAGSLNFMKIPPKIIPNKNIKAKLNNILSSL